MPGQGLEPVDEAVAAALVGGTARGPRLHDLAHHFLPFADHDHVHERGDRLRIREGADAAHHDHRVAGAPVGRADRDPRHAQEAHGVHVVALVGDREADQVEVGERALRLERERRGAGAPVLVQVLGVREEDALADHVRQRVQVVVDGLEAQVGHADRVGVRVHERHPDPAAPVLLGRTLLGRDEPLCLLLEFPGHSACQSTTGRTTGPEGGRALNERPRPGGVRGPFLGPRIRQSLKT